MIEAAETYFKESFKGSRGWKRGKPLAPRPSRRRGKATRRGISWQQVPVIAAIDRTGRKLEREVDYRDDVADALLEGIGNGLVLCTYGWSGFRRAVQASQSWHVVVRSPAKQEKPFEDQPKLQAAIRFRGRKAESRAGQRPAPGPEDLHKWTGERRVHSTPSRVLELDRGRLEARSGTVPRGPRVSSPSPGRQVPA